MRRLAGITLMAVMSCAHGLSAQGVTADGHFGLGATTLGDGGIAPVDLTFSLTLTRDLQIEAGTFAYALSDKRPHETYIGLHWRDWRAGVVRPSYDQVLSSVFEEAAPHLGYESAETTRAYTTTRAMRVNAVPVGLSYARDAGAVWWGLSVHDDAKHAFSSVTGAFQWQDGPWQIAGGVEIVRDNAGTIQGNAKLGLRWQSGTIGLGLTAYAPRASGQPDTAALDAHWQVSDALRLSAMTEQANSASASGVALRWTVSQSLSLSAAATRTDGDNGLHLTLNHRF